MFVILLIFSNVFHPFIPHTNIPLYLSYALLFGKLNRKSKKKMFTDRLLPTAQFSQNGTDVRVNLLT